MTLKDISFSGFFKIFFVVIAFIFLLLCVVGILAYTFVPDKISINQAKLFGIMTLDFGENSKSILFLLVVGIINLFGQSLFYALIAVSLTKIPFIGRIRIAPKLYNEQIFD